MQSKNSPPKLPPDIEKLLEEDPELKELFLKNWGVKNFGNKDDLFNSGPSFTGSSSPASEAYRSGPSYTGSSSPIGGGYSSGQRYSSGGGGCFIATAVYGSPMEESVIVLKRLRDDYLLKFTSGRKFIKFYYKHSPSIAKDLAEKPTLKKLVRFFLNPIVYVSKCFMAFFSKNT